MIIGRSWKTEFAVAERLDSDEVLMQHRQLLTDKTISLFYDFSPDFIVVLNEYRQIIFINRTLLNFLHKRAPEEVIGTRPGELLNCREAGRNAGGCGTSKFCRGCGAVRALLTALPFGVRMEECYIQTADGCNAYNFRVWASRPWKTNNYTLFILRDIADEKFRSALEQTFFHDLTNIAADFQGLLALIDSSETYWKYFPLLAGVNRELMEAISSQRDLRYAEEGKILIRKIPVDSLELMRDLVNLYKGQKVAAAIKLEIAADSENLRFSSDQRLLTRVLENLLKNAIEASGKGQTVTLACRRDGGQVVFSVHNPAFIEENIQLNLFKRAFSTKARGRGWGTYSMKLLTERYLGGKIRFSSTPADGTTFYAEYPLDK
ncbi:MAG: ATP-binding protein [Victivallaceae bacterium]|nr:ATP-binding protein [Victivallaceae bacterium]